MSSSKPFKPLRAVFLSFNNIDLIDIACPYETLHQVQDPATKNDLFRLEIAGPVDDNGSIKSYQGLSFKQHISYQQVLDEINDVDFLVVPGATDWPTTEHLINWSDFPVTKIIKKFSSLPPRDESSNGRPPRVILSICSGAFLIAAAGILANRRITTHFLILKELEELCAKVYGGNKPEVVRKKFVDAGTLDNGVRVIASGGLTSAFDASLYAIELVSSIQAAERVSKILDYQWVKSEGLI